jgi:hypothetical protein
VGVVVGLPPSSMPPSEAPSVAGDDAMDQVITGSGDIHMIWHHTVRGLWTASRGVAGRDLM